MLQEIKQYKVSLTVIAVLMMTKFILVPIFDWQDAELNEIRLLERQYSRIDHVLTHRDEIDEHLAELSTILKNSRNIFMLTEEPSTFQLQRQQWLEDKIKQHRLDTTNIGWSPSQEQRELDVVAHNVQLQIDGKTLDIIALIKELQSQPNYIEIQAFHFNFKRQRHLNLNTARVRLNLTFYRYQEPV